MHALEEMLDRRSPLRHAGAAQAQLLIGQTAGFTGASGGGVKRGL